MPCRRQAAISPDRSSAFHVEGARSRRRTRIYHVVVDLSGVEPAAVDNLQHSRHLAGRSEPEGADHPLVFQPLKRIGDAAVPQDLLRGDRAWWSVVRSDVIVQLQELDTISPQALEALREAPFDRRRRRRPDRPAQR